MTLSVASSFIIALAGIILLSMFLGVVLLAGWWQNHAAGRGHTRSGGSPGTPPVREEPTRDTLAAPRAHPTAPSLDTGPPKPGEKQIAGNLMAGPADAR